MINTVILKPALLAYQTIIDTTTLEQYEKIINNCNMQSKWKSSTDNFIAKPQTHNHSKELLVCSNSN